MVLKHVRASIAKIGQWEKSLRARGLMVDFAWCRVGAKTEADWLAPHESTIAEFLAAFSDPPDDVSRFGVAYADSPIRGRIIASPLFGQWYYYLFVHAEVLKPPKPILGERM